MPHRTARIVAAAGLALGCSDAKPAITEPMTVALYSLVPAIEFPNTVPMRRTSLTTPVVAPPVRGPT